MLGSHLPHVNIGSSRFQFGVTINDKDFAMPSRHDLFAELGDLDEIMKRLAGFMPAVN